ncbi:MAG: hypothetical protein BLITH_0417 [Brockia lithotrophica]|uniref:Uncharacterized protein n=1 Tax=Brockia lithotrophica TaxID=933949 RepID=A0A2T5GAY0_9BACL|nr:hypothetical protein [Brockia lithotrophica]PTQ53337.1 MAG: hypothetical protein BLITH_0417 [Brockia lithotrophica]
MVRRKGDELDRFLDLWTRVGAGILGAEFFLFFIVSAVEEIARNFLAGWLLAYSLLFAAYRRWGKTSLPLSGDERLTLLALLAAGGRIPAAVLAGLAAGYVGGLAGVYGAAAGAVFFYLVFFFFAGWWINTEGRTLRLPPSGRRD